ncbi:MAG: glycine cleavage system protein GcvH [Propionibacteriaceae bacterium]|nr:glycine cleavage system protein GcvH [Propionibacteriaceae bacterium]
MTRRMMADYPEDLRYTADHEWVKEGNDTTVRVGITDYAASALGDVVFVSLPDPGDAVRAGDSVAELESTKSVSEVFSPVSGVIARINEAVAESPDLVNEDPYGDGWLFEVDMSDSEELDGLLDSAAYGVQFA